jgi:hypothetical protein
MRARCCQAPDAFLEAERQSVRAFSLAYSNMKKPGKLIARIEGHIDNCLCYRQG